MIMKRMFISMLLIVTVASSCSNFEDLNTNPDSTTKVTSEMLATEALKQTFISKGDAKAYIGRNALSKYVGMDRDIPSEQYNLISGCSFDSYTIIPNLDKMVEYALGTKYESAFKGLAAFIKAYNFYRLTMMTGDIPCSEAAQALDGIRQPKYDLQKDVLDEILRLLQVADKEFAEARDFGGDFVFGGDTEKWKKATNAFCLKVLISMSAKITPEQKELFSEIVRSSVLMEDNSDNLQLIYTSTKGTWHPLYNQTLFAPYTVVSSIMVDELKKLKDRRLFYIAEPAPEKTDEGKDATDYDAYNGVEMSISSDELSLDFHQGKYSIINKRYISEQAGDPFVLLSYAEQCFIIAEAAERGWLNVDSRNYYEKGVTAALQMFASYDKENVYNHGMKIDDAYISSYFVGEAAYKATTQERLQQIWMQKYFIKFLQDGVDAYFDFRRNGYPEFPVDPETNLNIDNKSGFPMRWKYPSGEYQTNENNVNEALQRQFTKGYDGINELMWLLKD